MSQPDPYAAIEHMQGAEAVLSEWESRFGSSLHALKPFLVQGQTKAMLYPCPECGGSMQLAEHPQDGSFAFHAEHDRCKEVQLSEADRQCYGFNMRRWLEKLCLSLSIESAVSRHSGSIWRVGSIRIGQKRHPVFLLLDPGGTYLQSAMQLCSLADRQALVFTPRYCPYTADWLKQKQHGYFPLRDLVDFESLEPAADYGAELQNFTDLASSNPDGYPSGSRPDHEAPTYIFQNAGHAWKIRFNGSRAFILKDSYGAKYLNYLFHHPNDPIGALELEVAINPEKESVRTKEAVHKLSDGKARKQYEKRLRALVGDRENLGGNASELERVEIDDEIEKLTKLLTSEDALIASDAGENARQNVGKAITSATKALRKLEAPGAKALAQHISDHVSKGYSLNYNKPENITWA